MFCFCLVAVYSLNANSTDINKIWFNEIAVKAQKVTDVEIIFNKNAIVWQSVTIRLYDENANEFDKLIYVLYDADASDIVYHVQFNETIQFNDTIGIVSFFFCFCFVCSQMHLSHFLI